MPPRIKEDVETSNITENIYNKFVILFNDNVNSFEHVEQCLMNICKKNKAEAESIAWEAHSNGKAECYRGSIEACEHVAEKMGQEQLTVEIQS